MTSCINRGGLTVRLSVWVPDELADTIKERLPMANVSRVLQDGLRSLLKCPHDTAACGDCGAPMDKAQIIDEALSSFYRALMWELHDLVNAGGTAEGAARVLKGVGEAHQVSAARRISLPRPPRGVRARREWDRRWLEEQQRLELG